MKIIYNFLIIFNMVLTGGEFRYWENNQSSYFLVYPDHDQKEVTYAYTSNGNVLYGVITVANSAGDTPDILYRNRSANIFI